MTIELINSLFNFNRLYFYNETFMSLYFRMPICQRCGKDSGIFYTVLLEIINQQSQDTVYNDFKDFCQKCAILLNAIYREAIRQQNCLKLLNIIILIEIQSYSNYKIHRYHNLLLLLRSSIVVGYGFNL